MKHTGLCTSAWSVCSGNLNISGIYGAESRYGGVGRLLWITTQPAAAVVAATRHHPFAYVCVHAPSVCALCPFSNATKGQKAIRQSGASPPPEHFSYTHRRCCPSQTTLKSNSSGWIIKSLVFWFTPVHVQCTSCAVRRPPAGCCRLPASQLCRDRLQIEINVLCFSPVQKPVEGQFVSMMKPLLPFEVLQIKPSASKTHECNLRQESGGINK